MVLQTRKWSAQIPNISTLDLPGYQMLSFADLLVRGQTRSTAVRTATTTEDETHVSAFFGIKTFLNFWKGALKSSILFSQGTGASSLQK